MKVSVHQKHGFSMIELVIVIAIMGVLASIVALRANNVGGNADEVAVDATIVTLQKSLEHYSVEHLGSYPKVSTMAAQLTQFTDVHGNVSPTKTGQFVFGPYLRQMPRNLLVLNKARDEDSNSGVGDDFVELELDVSTGAMKIIQLRGTMKNKALGQRLVDAKLATDLPSLGL